MTNRNKKRRSAEASGYRKPQALPEPAPRRGFLESFLPARPAGGSPVPRVAPSFVRGLAFALSTPVVLVGVPLILLAGWLTLVAVGFQGPFKLLLAMFALPPVGTLLQDLGLASALGSFFLVFGFAAIRALLVSAVTTMAVERFRTGDITSWSARRLVRVFPFELMVNILCLSGSYSVDPVVVPRAGPRLRRLPRGGGGGCLPVGVGRSHRGRRGPVVHRDLPTIRPDRPLARFRLPHALDAVRDRRVRLPGRRHPWERRSA